MALLQSLQRRPRTAALLVAPEPELTWEWSTNRPRVNSLAWASTDGASAELRGEDCVVFRLGDAVPLKQPIAATASVVRALLFFSLVFPPMADSIPLVAQSRAPQSSSRAGGAGDGEEAELRADGGARRRHALGSKSNSDEAALRLTVRLEAGAQVAAPRVALRTRLVAIHEGHHAERWRLAKECARGGDRLANQLRRRWLTCQFTRPSPSAPASARAPSGWRARGPRPAAATRAV